MKNKKIISITVSILLLLTLFISSPFVLQSSANPQKAYNLTMAILTDSSTYIGSSYSDTDPQGTRQGAVISTPKGSFPTNGSQFIILSTGIAGTPICTTNALDPGSERGTYFHGRYNLPRDQATLTITLQVPLFMHQIAYDVQFLTSEYPEYLNSQYNDKFTATVNSPSMGTSVYIIDVNGGDFVLDSNDITGTGFDIYAVSGDPYESVNIVTTTPNNAPDGGATALVTRQHPVSPGEIITITFDIVDTGDNQFDSAVFIDNLHFTDEKRTEMIGRKIATDLNGGKVECGDEIKYTITLSNIGTKAQLDLDGPEFVDPIPENTTYVPGSVTASSGTAEYLASENKIIWNGAIHAESSVKIEFNVIVNQGLPNEAEIFNQGIIYWDKNSTGQNTDTELTDDPTVPGNHQPTILYVYVARTEMIGRKIATDLNGGKVECGDEIKYTITLSNIGTKAQLDLDGPEFVDPIPENTTYVPGSVTASSGTAEYLASENKIIWNGAIHAESSVKIEFNVIVNQGLPNEAEIFNQGIIYWDKNSTGQNTDTELTDDPTVPGNHQPTILYVHAPEFPSELREDFSDDLPGRKAVGFEKDHQWFETSTIDNTGIFAVAETYCFTIPHSFKTKLRGITPLQYWNYSLAPLQAKVSSWEVMFICGKSIEPYTMYMNFTNTQHQLLAQLRFDYRLSESNGAQKYLPVLEFSNNDGTWTQLQSDKPGGYLHHDWYKLRITMETPQLETYQLYRQGAGLVSEYKNVTGAGTTPFSQLSKIAWYTLDDPIVCPMLFFDEHILYLLPLSLIQ